MKRARGAWWSLFAEYAIAALAEATVAAVGWLLRRVIRWWKKRRRKRDED